MQEIVYDGKPIYDKVEIWRDDKGLRLRIRLKDPSLGLISLYSDYYGGILEADSRAVFVASRLGLDRDNLPVHVKKT